MKNIAISDEHYETLLDTIRLLLEGRDNTREFLSLASQYTKLNVPSYESITELYKAIIPLVNTHDGHTINAPWSDEQVNALNRYQQSGKGHPFTGERHPDGSERILIATNLGWIGEQGGPVIQTWAWKFMAK